MESLPLPSEIWTQIFELAADEDILFQQGIPTSMAESAWFRNEWIPSARDLQVAIKGSGYNKWELRSPQRAMQLLEERSYATKKAIISTCRQWRQWGSEFLFRCLYFSSTQHLLALVETLDASSSISSTATASHGWWTRRIHLAADHRRSLAQSPSELEIEEALVSIIKHCPNVEIFVIERPLGVAFGPVVDALSRHASANLHTVVLTIPGSALSKIIWAFHALPHIISAHIVVDSPVPPSQEIAHLGSAGGMHLHLPNLQQLSVAGYVAELLEQVAGWELPGLRSFSIATDRAVDDFPDAVEFLRHHGTDLDFLDLNIRPVVDVPLVLDLCPNLTTFCFNADWRLRGSMADPNTNTNTEIVNRPHGNITAIGLYGLNLAFGVGSAFTSSRALSAGLTKSIEVHTTTRSNELNLASILLPRHFPRLQRVRALSKRMLEDLNDANGPGWENGGYARWNSWWAACTKRVPVVRLEDCTGGWLGTLPQEDEEDESDDESSDEEDEEDEVYQSLEGVEEEDEEDDEDEEEEEDDDEASDDDTWGTGSAPDDDPNTTWHSPENPLQVPVSLTQLLQEVRAMNETRDEALIRRVRIPRPTSPWGS